jgi:hypothetical protein
MKIYFGLGGKFSYKEGKNFIYRQTRKKGHFLQVFTFSVPAGLK